MQIYGVNVAEKKNLTDTSGMTGSVKKQLEETFQKLKEKNVDAEVFKKSYYWASSPAMNNVQGWVINMENGDPDGGDNPGRYYARAVVAF